MILSTDEEQSRALTRRIRSGHVLLACTLVAIAFWLGREYGDREHAVERAPNTSQELAATPHESTSTTLPRNGGNAQVSSSVSVPTPEPSAQHLMFTAATAAEGLRLAQARFQPDSYALNRAKQDVRSLCGGWSDRRGSLHHDAPDPTRDWVIEAIIDYCAEWSPDAFKAASSADAPVSLHMVLREQGVAAAIDAAHGQVADSDDAATLHEAALLLFEQGEIPDSGSVSTGPADATAAIAFSARLIGCNASATCGPRSPLTLSYCVDVGCTPGVTFLDALRENLPASEFALVQWYYHWMDAQRRGRG